MQTEYMDVSLGKDGGAPFRAMPPARRTGPRHAADRRRVATRPMTRAARAAARRKRRLRGRLTLLAAAVLCVLLMGTALARRREKPEERQWAQPEDPATATAALIPAGGTPYTVAIDAGHGGADVGAQGVVTESTLTEMTIGYLEQWLTRDENYTPVRTHAYDTQVENTQRAETANEAGAALLLSVHANADPSSSSTTGFECYPQTPGRTYHDAAAYFAHLIAGRFGRAGQRLRGEAGVRYIYYVGDDNTVYEKQIVEESDTTVREEQSFGILEKTDCPAVLCEQCFVTSEFDAVNWGLEAGCQRAARIYYEAVCEYFGTQPLPEA